MSMSLLLGWGVMGRIKIPQQDYALKMQGRLMCEGGGGIFAGHYGTHTQMLVHHRVLTH